MNQIFNWIPTDSHSHDQIGNCSIILQFLQSPMQRKDQSPLLPSTNDNLRQYAMKPLAQWLIHAAKHQETITYGEVKQRLQEEIGFRPMHWTRPGNPAEQLMDRMLEVRRQCPPLNTLLVRKADNMPSDGAGRFMADYLGDDRLAEKGFRKENIHEWGSKFETIKNDIFAFRHWDQVYDAAFGESLPPSVPAPPRSTEKDGIRHGRGGEGQKHKELRFWVLWHPSEINYGYADFKTRTEVVLESADRVDVVYYGPDSTIAIEVKSIDSNKEDLRRGVFQCIKYRAVLEAMGKPNVASVLVTQTPLPEDLSKLARQHDIGHFKAPKF